MANIASTILEQLGGRRFIAMTGAKNFVAVAPGNTLVFRLPAKFAKNKANYVRITLTPDDLYTVEFSYLRAMNLRDISRHEGIYCDQLRELFTTETGLYTSL